MAKPHFCLLAALMIIMCGCTISIDHRDDEKVVNEMNNRYLNTACVDGYSYLVYRKGPAAGLTQMWERTESGPQPMLCTPEVKP